MGDNFYLSHHGIKDMRWGVWNEETRRRRLGIKKRKANSKKEAEKKRTDNPRKEAAKRKAERRKADKYSSLLSDKELDKRIKRLEKEKKLRELTSSEINSGRKATNEFLSKYGNQIAAAVIAAVAAEVAAQMVFRNKSKRQAEEKWIKKNHEKYLEKQKDRSDKINSTMVNVGKSIVTGNGLPAISNYANSVGQPRGKHARIG